MHHEIQVSDNITSTIGIIKVYPLRGEWDMEVTNIYIEEKNKSLLEGRHMTNNKQRYWIKKCPKCGRSMYRSITDKGPSIPDIYQCTIPACRHSEDFHE